MSTFKELMTSCVTLLASYTPELQDPEEYLRATIPQVLRGKGEKDEAFVTEVFFGCLRHALAIKAIVESFYALDDNKLLVEHKSFFEVVCYLLLFRMDELGLSQFRRLIFTQNRSKLSCFLKYVLDETFIKGVVFPEWCRYYDHSYAQLSLLSPLLRWLPELIEMQSGLSTRTKDRNQPKNQKRSTDVKPFNLTKPRARSVPMPDKIPNLKPTNPVPQSTYTPPKEVDILSRVKATHRQRSERRLIEASNKQFACASTEMSDKSRHKMAEYIRSEEAKLNFDRPKAIPLPPSPVKSAPIRLNAATILREGILAQKKEEEEDQRLMDFTVGGRDASDFLRWQESMRQKDLQQQLADIERRRLEGKLSYEDAIYARQLLIKNNRKVVQNMKLETEQLMQKSVKEKIERDTEMRNLIEQIMADHENTREAKRRLQEYKSNIVKNVNKESRALMQQAIEKEEAEMRQKVALIAKIRAIESVPINRFKRFDETESSGAGLLGEMSVAELWGRLSILKTTEHEEEEKRRDEILLQKSEKDQLLLDTLEVIARDRVKRTANTTRREESTSLHGNTSLQNDDRIIELQKKLEQRRTERKQSSLEMATSSIGKKRHSELKREKKSLEEMRWLSLESNREKNAKAITSKRAINRVTTS